MILRAGRRRGADLGDSVSWWLWPGAVIRGITFNGIGGHRETYTHAHARTHTHAHVCVGTGTRTRARKRSGRESTFPACRFSIGPRRNVFGLHNATNGRVLWSDSRRRLRVFCFSVRYSGSSRRTRAAPGVEVTADARVNTRREKRDGGRRRVPITTTIMPMTITITCYCVPIESEMDGRAETRGDVFRRTG